ncbi:MAG: hypothetical protein OXF85_02130 [Candidatus Saccharibacteria bacterium]|nr:hypothetical protein [Candidatus Saccharibacteria bacterium]MCY4089093.1 hypothetical protein [Candidatus Saccharibacteria bacterium]
MESSNKTSPVDVIPSVMVIILSLGLIAQSALWLILGAERVDSNSNVAEALVEQAVMQEQTAEQLAELMDEILEIRNQLENSSQLDNQNANSDDLASLMLFLGMMLSSEVNPIIDTPWGDMDDIWDIPMENYDMDDCDGICPPQGFGDYESEFFGNDMP